MTGKQKGDQTGDAPADDAARRKAKASVHEAIGKLIGDDAEVARGAAEKDAVQADAGKSGAGK